MSIKPQAIMLLAGWLLAAPAMALTATNDGSGSNTYMFIDNDVDDEYFITTSSLSPRFTGANIWTKYKTNQRSLGYMGNSGWSYSNRYFDLWIDNSPINQPFLGSAACQRARTARLRAISPPMYSTKTASITRCPATAWPMVTTAPGC